MQKVAAWKCSACKSNPTGPCGVCGGFHLFLPTVLGGVVQGLEIAMNAGRHELLHDVRHHNDEEWHQFDTAWMDF